MRVRALKQITHSYPAEQDFNLSGLETDSLLLPQYRVPTDPRPEQRFPQHRPGPPVTAAPGKCQKCSFLGSTPDLWNQKPWDWRPRNFGWIKTLGGDSRAHSSRGILCPLPPSPISSQLGSSPILSTFQGSLLRQVTELMPCLLPGMSLELVCLKCS